ncbi:hypothetical protein WOLCODRAFT_152871 [Wolfiporia cocos MD-104 SS10]|uniref:Uncharacterized protein n=1 Tax=Wolfiporia cocos (strain MD-104) TaxID=742152 RepID=A0A2H3JMU1_WOLCO|nr:hypothetical protein WOLCODRAFT_152871 [Wolfiporia cocos MD-104 SS10]
MEPATSVDEVKAQLRAVAPKLHELSNVRNRLPAAAVPASPSRSTPLDGSLDAFFECPLNKGPATGTQSPPPQRRCRAATRKGTSTMKMVWSFDGSLDDAMRHETRAVSFRLQNSLGEEERWWWLTCSHFFLRRSLLRPAIERSFGLFFWLKEKLSWSAAAYAPVLEKQGQLVDEKEGARSLGALKPPVARPSATLYTL